TPPVRPGRAGSRWPAVAGSGCRPCPPAAAARPDGWRARRAAPPATRRGPSGAPGGARAAPPGAPPRARAPPAPPGPGRGAPAPLRVAPPQPLGVTAPGDDLDAVARHVQPPRHDVG